jgi:hypothetical protein
MDTLVVRDSVTARVPLDHRPRDTTEPLTLMVLTEDKSRHKRYDAKKRPRSLGVSETRSLGDSDSRTLGLSESDSCCRPDWHDPGRVARIKKAHDTVVGGRYQTV